MICRMHPLAEQSNSHCTNNAQVCKVSRRTLKWSNCRNEKDFKIDNPKENCKVVQKKEQLCLLNCALFNAFSVYKS
jgi:hypothetical protein